MTAIHTIDVPITFDELTEPEVLPEETPPFSVIVHPDFWGTKNLQRIRDYGLANLVAPTGLVAATLSRVIAATPPNVQGPGRTEQASTGHSLNMFLGLLGPSGAGKSTAIAHARTLFPAHASSGDAIDIDGVELGSGQGAERIWFEKVDEDQRPVAGRGKGTYEQTRNRILFVVGEAETLSRLDQMSGSTLGAVMRKMFGGEPLGTAWADQDKRACFTEAGSYRAVLQFALQPGLIDTLLGGQNAETGTAGRLLWAPVIDHALPHPSQAPKSPPPFTRNDWRCPSGKPVVFKLPAAVRTEMDNLNHARATGIMTVPAIDTHRVVIRQSVAAALALLENPDADTISQDDWDRSGMLLVVSDQIREAAMTYSAAQSALKVRREGHKEAARQIARDDVLAKEQVGRDEKIRSRIINNLKGSGPIAGSKLRGKFSGPERSEFDRVIDDLIDDGFVTKSEVGNGRRYSLAGPES